MMDVGLDDTFAGDFQSTTLADSTAATGTTLINTDNLEDFAFAYNCSIQNLEMRFTLSGAASPVQMHGVYQFFGRINTFAWNTFTFVGAGTTVSTTEDIFSALPAPPEPFTIATDMSYISQSITAPGRLYMDSSPLFVVSKSDGTGFTNGQTYTVHGGVVRWSMHQHSY
jgi:hypothetical protein